MRHLRLRIRVLERRPGDDEDEGRFLADLVRHALESGKAAPVAVVVRERRTELVGLQGLAGVPVRSFLAGLCASVPDVAGPARAVGVAGRFLLRTPADREGRGAPVGLAFLEWPDCRWWLSRVLLDAGGHPVPKTEIVRRAFEGDALPSGLGRWWSESRRTGAVVRYGAVEPAAAASTLVH